MDQLKKLAGEGDREAQNKLAILYYSGEGVPKDREKAVQLFTESADSGCALAMYLLGLMYVDGDDVPRDYYKATLLLQEAASKGEPRATKMLEEVSMLLPRDLRSDPKYLAVMLQGLQTGVQAAVPTDHLPELEKNLYVSTRSAKS